MYSRLLERGTQASTSAVTASTSDANIAYWSLLRGKSGPPTEVGRFVRTPRTPYAYAPASILVTLNTFLSDSDDVRLFDILARDMFQYMLVALCTTNLSVPRPDVKAFFPDLLESCQRKTQEYYLGVLDLPADSMCKPSKCV